MRKTNESGRSMVEMLGVLAIIGVLSVGGIAGYTMAMRSYQANEILQAASMLAMEARLKESSTALKASDIGIKKIPGMTKVGEGATGDSDLQATYASGKVTVSTTDNIDKAIGNAVCAKLTTDTSKLVYADGTCKDGTIKIIYNYNEVASGEE